MASRPPLPSDIWNLAGGMGCGVITYSAFVNSLGLGVSPQRELMRPFHSQYRWNCDGPDRSVLSNIPE